MNLHRMGLKFPTDKNYFAQKGDEQAALNTCRGDEGGAGESGEEREGLRPL